MMRNAANKMTNPIDPYTENHFLSFIEISERNGSLCVSHFRLSMTIIAQMALARLATYIAVVYPTLELICDFWS